jgi:hypothetical protein
MEQAAAAAAAGREVSETARQLAIAERWGCVDTERLSRVLLAKTVFAVFSNQARLIP